MIYFRISTYGDLLDNIVDLGDREYFFQGCFHNLHYYKEGVYKAFLLTRSGKLKCRNKVYEVGKKALVRGPLKLCANGIHYCTNLFDIFDYYYGKYGRDFVVAKCEVSDENICGSSDSKHCARWITPKQILTREELLAELNSGTTDPRINKILDEFFEKAMEEERKS